MVNDCRVCFFFFFFSSRRRHTRLQGDWSSDVCSSDLEEDNPVGDRVVMLSEQCWHRVFAADPMIVGRVLTLEGLPFTVIGVYPSRPSTQLPNELISGSTSDYWQALRLDERRAPPGLHFLS